MGQPPGQGLPECCGGAVEELREDVLGIPAGGQLEELAGGLVGAEQTTVLVEHHDAGERRGEQFGAGVEAQPQGAAQAVDQAVLDGAGGPAKAAEYADDK